MYFIHYTEVPNPPDALFAREWAVYVREMPRWLAEGHKGRFVLIKGDQVLGIHDTWRQAVDTGHEKPGNVPMMVHQILAWVPVLRHGYSRLCPAPSSSGGRP
jgi:hypothetical protein